MDGKILLIIDAQYDFINGSLAVDGALEMMHNVADFILENGPSYNEIVLTADWHPNTHCSFKENGGIWPQHCVQFTNGAAIYQPIMDALDKIGRMPLVLTKGTDEDHEQYSIFKNEISKTKLIKLCDWTNTTHIDCCGIALDYCVKDTISDGLRELPNVDFNLLLNMTPSIGNKDEVIKFFEDKERVCMLG